MGYPFTQFTLRQLRIDGHVFQHQNMQIPIHGTCFMAISPQPALVLQLPVKSQIGHHLDECIKLHRLA
jgi:hypothetical protein